MTIQSAVKKRERSLMEVVIVVLLFLSLMAVFIHYFFKNEANMRATGFSNIVNTFAAQLTAIRSQWLMDGRPTAIKLAVHPLVKNGQNHRIVQLSANGWVISREYRYQCQDIWKTVMATPMEFLQQPIVVIEVNRQHDDDARAWNAELICRYQDAFGHSFEYNVANGKVSRQLQTSEN